MCFVIPEGYLGGFASGTLEHLSRFGAFEVCFGSQSEKLNSCLRRRRCRELGGGVAGERLQDRYALWVCGRVSRSTLLRVIRDRRVSVWGFLFVVGGGRHSSQVPLRLLVDTG